MRSFLRRRNRLRRGRYLTRLCLNSGRNWRISAHLARVVFRAEPVASNDRCARGRTVLLSDDPQQRGVGVFVAQALPAGGGCQYRGRLGFRWKPLRSLTGSSLRRWSDSSSFRSQPCISKYGNVAAKSSRVPEFWTASRMSKDARLKWPSSGVAPSILLPPSPIFSLRAFKLNSFTAALIELGRVRRYRCQGLCHVRRSD